MDSLRALLRASRQEIQCRLEVREGKLPEDLLGHVFMVAPVGSVEDGDAARPGKAILSGDGMVYRIDFDRPGEARVKTRLVRPPSYLDDVRTYEALQHGKWFPALWERFRTSGLSRLSHTLGIRELVNTAFQPFQFATDPHERLLVTSDTVRPFEIDPATLDTLAPVGSRQEWRPVLGKHFWKYPLIMSTAHPAFDSTTGELFLANYGRSLASTFLPHHQTGPGAETAEKAVLALARHSRWRLLLLLLHALLHPLRTLHRLAEWLMDRLRGWSQRDDFTYLLRWKGQRLERWELVHDDPRQSPIHIQQTLHQMAVTRDHVVLLDAAFKVKPDQLTDFPSWLPKGIKRFLRRALSGPQLPYSRIYLVNRADLAEGLPGDEASSPAPRKVPARQFVIDPEAIHFLADYENPDGHVTVHLTHNSALDLAEWVRGFDTYAFQPGKAVSPDLVGMLATGQVDISRQGRYELGARTGKLRSSGAFFSVDDPNTFNVGLYAHAGAQPATLEHIYWSGGGYQPELLTQFIYDLYKDYPQRVLTLTQFWELTKGGRPSNLFRLDTRTLTAGDSYVLGKQCVLMSPQFVPRRGASGEPMDGYILCMVISGEKDPCCELWVFDAGNLAKGPLCKLAHPELKFGLLLHTTWMAAIPTSKES
jgi:carotenoid cleavage dioxygenase-like enzyme